MSHIYNIRYRNDNVELKKEFRYKKEKMQNKKFFLM